MAMSASESKGMERTRSREGRYGEWVRGLEKVNGQIGVQKRERKDTTDLNYTTPARVQEFFP